MYDSPQNITNFQLSCYSLTAFIIKIVFFYPTTTQRTQGTDAFDPAIELGTAVVEEVECRIDWFASLVA